MTHSCGTHHIVHNRSARERGASLCQACNAYISSRRITRCALATYTARRNTTTVSESVPGCDRAASKTACGTRMKASPPVACSHCKHHEYKHASSASSSAHLVVNDSVGRVIPHHEQEMANVVMRCRRGAAPSVHKRHVHQHNGNGMFSHSR